MMINHWIGLDPIFSGKPKSSVLMDNLNSAFESSHGPEKSDRLNLGCPKNWPRKPRFTRLQ